jgi:hypothetical protein
MEPKRVSEPEVQRHRFLEIVAVDADVDSDLNRPDRLVQLGRR